MACTFCAASKLTAQDMTPKEVADTANQIQANTIILLGGEALLMGPDFYKELLTLTDAHLSFTTNLKQFYLYPDEWVSLFKNDRVSVATSFNYGNSRLWDPNTVYTEDMFIKVETLFKEKIGYVPMFISVLDKHNVHTWRKHIELAKRLNTKCRLNNALKIGRQGEWFPRYELFKIWIQIAKEGLDQYEQNTLERGTGRCPINNNRLCASTIRVVQKDPTGKLIYFNCDDRSNMGMEPFELEKTPVEPKPSTLKPMFGRCYYCELYEICNGCETNLMQITDKEVYCQEMLKLKDDLITYGWVSR